MLLILGIVLILLWLAGFFVLHVSSFLIHLLLIFALISIVMNFVSGKRAFRLAQTKGDPRRVGL